MLDGRGDHRREDASRRPPDPAMFSSRYPSGVDEFPTCHRNMISSPLPTQAGLSGDPATDGPVQTLLAPVARETTSMPSWQAPLPQGSTSMASWLPSGDSAAESEIMYGTWIGRWLSCAERPSAATRSRKNPRSSVMTKVRPSADAVIPDGMGGGLPSGRLP